MPPPPPPRRHVSCPRLHASALRPCSAQRVRGAGVASRSQSRERGKQSFSRGRVCSTWKERAVCAYDLTEQSGKASWGRRYSG